MTSRAVDRNAACFVHSPAGAVTVMPLAPRNATERSSASLATAGDPWVKMTTFWMLRFNPVPSTGRFSRHRRFDLRFKRIKPKPFCSTTLQMQKVLHVASGPRNR